MRRSSDKRNKRFSLLPHDSQQYAASLEAIIEQDNVEEVKPSNALNNPGKQFRHYAVRYESGEDGFPDYNKPVVKVLRKGPPKEKPKQFYLRRAQEAVEANRAALQAGIAHYIKVAKQTMVMLESAKSKEDVSAMCQSCHETWVTGCRKCLLWCSRRGSTTMYRVGQKEGEAFEAWLSDRRAEVDGITQCFEEAEAHALEAVRKARERDEKDQRRRASWKWGPESPTSPMARLAEARRFCGEEDIPSRNTRERQEEYITL